MEKHLQSKINHLRQILGDYLDSPATDNLDIWLSDFFKKHKKYGSNDRRFLRDTLYDILRTHGLYAYTLSPESTRQRFQSIATAANLSEYLKTLDCNELSSFIEIKVTNEANEADQAQEAIEDKVDKTGFKRKKNTAREGFIAIPESLDLKNPVDLAVAVSCSIDTAETLLKSYGHLKSIDLRQTIQYLTKQARAWVRLADPKSASLISKEASDNDVVFAEENGFYYFVQSPKIKNFKTYRDGHFEFQDLASQQLVVSKDQTFSPAFIWDVCAGAGGKTLQLRTLYPSAHILASDIRAHSLEKLRLRSKKSRLENIQTLRHDATQTLASNAGFKHPRSSERIDLIVIDAPCSSSGTLRRSPDQKLRLSKDTIDHYTSLQKKILENSSKSLSAGGQLIYSTCSMFREENEDIIESFLQTAKDFVLISTSNFAPPEYDSDFMFKAEIRKN